MLDPREIDDVLANAQTAVDELAGHTADWVAKPPQSAHTGGRPVPAAASVASGGVERILRLRVPVVVRLAERTMPLSEVLKLTPGSIIEFERNVNAELDLLVNNCRIGSGEAIKVGEHFGIRISFVGDVRQRVESLGGS